MCIYNKNDQRSVDAAYAKQQAGSPVYASLGDMARRKTAQISEGETTVGLRNTPALGTAGLSPGAATQRNPSLLGSDPGTANTAARRRRTDGRAGMSSTGTDPMLGTNTLLGG